MAKRLTDRRRKEKAIIHKKFQKADRNSNRIREPISKDNNEYWSCARKKYIKSREHAIVKARAMYVRYGETQNLLYYYGCPHCKGFHLTHRPGEGSVLISRKIED